MGVAGGGGMFFLHFMIFPTFIEKKILGIKNYCRKSILFHLMVSLCFFPNIFRIFLEILKSAPSLLVKWEVVSPNSRYCNPINIREPLISQNSRVP